MPQLNKIYSVREGRVSFKSGHIYRFKYLNYENDPEPTIICINAIRGIHPKTRKMHNYIQGINFTYIPRNQRKIFAKVWMDTLEKNHGHILLTWKLIKKRWPWMVIAIRRYILGAGYIRDAKEFRGDEMQVAIIGTWRKDFSSRITRAKQKGKKWLKAEQRRFGL